MATRRNVYARKKFESLNKLIGRTPLIKIGYKYNGEIKTCCCKAEWYNLSGSIKDRVAYYILKKAYEEKQIDENSTIAEVTSGNMGIAFAAVSRYLGNKMVAILPKFMSEERFKILRMYGAELDLTESFEDAFIKAETYKGKAFLPYQFENKYNDLLTMKQLLLKLKLKLINILALSLELVQLVH